MSYAQRSRLRAHVRQAANEQRQRIAKAVHTQVTKSLTPLRKPYIPDVSLLQPVQRKQALYEQELQSVLGLSRETSELQIPRLSKALPRFQSDRRFPRVLQLSKRLKVSGTFPQKTAR